GMKFAPDLKDPRNVVAIQWGNINGASFYAREERVPEVALLLARTRGIDVVAYREGEDIEVLSDRGGRLQRARVTCDARRLRCRYLEEDGDPLNYASAIDALRRKGRMDARGFATSDAWFDATQDHFYPDALYR